MKTSDVILNTDIDENCGCQTDADMNYKKPEMDHEVQMARSELYRAAHSAIELHKMLRMINERQGIEGWVAAKITKAADYLESVYHYLDYEMRFANNDLGEQATIGTPGTTPAANPAAAAALAAQQIAAKKKEIQDQIKAKHTEISTLQRQMSAVGTGRLVQSTYESASAGSTSSGGIASTANGFAKGGPGTMARAKKVKEDPAPDNEETYKVRVKTATAEKSVAEAKGLKKRVRVVKTGETGTIGEVKHGLFKGAPKEFIVDLDKGGNIRATAAELRLIKDKDMAENTGPKFTGYYKGTDKGKPGKKMVGSD